MRDTEYASAIVTVTDEAVTLKHLKAGVVTGATLHLRLISHIRYA